MAEFLPVFTFYAFAAIILGSALMVITRRDALTAAVFLAFCLVAVGGLYITQHAEFLFAVQVMVYTGGVMVLFMFAIMLVESQGLAAVRPRIRRWGVPATLAIATFVLIAISTRSGTVTTNRVGIELRAIQSNTEAVATTLLTNYLLPFEIVSVLLLVAMIGAIVLAKKEL